MRRGSSGVRIAAVEGELSDHYDPTNRVLRLSPRVFEGRSAAALGIAAHEAGHAIQHAPELCPIRRPERDGPGGEPGIGRGVDRPAGRPGRSGS